jgi:hypothetical protein
MVFRVDDIGMIVDLHCLEVFVRVDDIGVIVDLHCLEVFVRVDDIGVIVDLLNDHTNIINTNKHL